MFFYKVEANFTAAATENEDSRRTRRENARKICDKAREFNQKMSPDSFYFIAETDAGICTGGIISSTDENVEKNLRKFLTHVECPSDSITITEVTLRGVDVLLGRANRNGYIPDDDTIRDQFGISEVLGQDLDFGDNILDERSREQIIDTVHRHLFDNSFLPELDRIYAGRSARSIPGHPVHYLFQVDDRDVRRNIYQALLQALYANGRLKSKRYAFLDIRPGENFSARALQNLYKLCQGGAVVVRYCCAEGGNESNHASTDTWAMETVCQLASTYRNRTLTVLCLPRESTRTRSQFYEHLGGMTFVELKEDMAKGERAVEMLKAMAKEHKLRADKRLFVDLDMDKNYLGTELSKLFDEWYDHKLKTTVYPQYKTLNSVKKETVKSTPQGSAFEKLQEMVGLTEAKAVINKALNYYKMQKLYEDKGIKRDVPAMHMVFTGNPGTAKTTAARLFAQIMRDNGLLSRGHLVEVGRSDLVGKYVGWTAKAVQAKFKQAMGGVLFIDEAYSLVDGDSGSFGDEAINTIVQEMENYRESLVVIFAGYPKEMEQFLQRNPGLRSRIAFHVPFSDYNAQELCRIAVAMGRDKGVSFDEAAMEKLNGVFEVACKQSDFGNGRFVRNILEQAKMNQASRLLEGNFEDITLQQIQTIRAEDILIPETKTETRRAIGFAS